MKRILLWIAGFGIAATLAASVYFRTASDDPTVWHVDPITVERTGNPNDYIVAPEGLRADTPDRIATVQNGGPKELLFQFDSIAGAVSTELAGSLEELHITYVQRTSVMGYPDYISVKAVEVDGGAALVIYSRSRFGKSDFGVNRERIDRWLAQIGDS
jgi:hypothetical protein